MMEDFQTLARKFDTAGESESPPAKPTILVIDDDPSLRRGLKRAFSHKYNVISAENGQVGIDRLSADVHCVILDIKMKGLSGFATFPRLKAKQAEVPIIFFTAFQSEHDLQEIINTYKPEGYLEKGRDISLLENVIDNAVKRYALVLEKETYRQELETTNIALNALIKKMEADRKEVEANILSSVNDMVMPHLEKLKGKITSEPLNTHLAQMESNLYAIISPFARRLTSPRYNFTCTELEVANLIKHDRSTKEIAGLLHVSEKTIESHRDNIRRKLGIKNKPINLKSHLLSLREY